MRRGPRGRSEDETRALSGRGEGDGKKGPRYRAKLDRVRKPKRRRKWHRRPYRASAHLAPPCHRGKGAGVPGSWCAPRLGLTRGRVRTTRCAGRRDESYRRRALRARVLPSHCTSCTMTTMTSTTIAVTAESYCWYPYTIAKSPRPPAPR